MFMCFLRFGSPRIPCWNASKIFPEPARSTVEIAASVPTPV